jgi:hypothetical protein
MLRMSDNDNVSTRTQRLDLLFGVLDQILWPVDASAVGSFALFAGFIATMARSDFSRPCIIG